MTEVITFPAVEEWAVGYLPPLLAGVDVPYADEVVVATRLPNPRAGRVVVVTRTGGPRLDVVRDLARLSVRVYADNAEDCSDLTGLVRALLEAAAGDGPVVGVRYATGPVELPEESAAIVRFFTVELLLRGTAL